MASFLVRNVFDRCAPDGSRQNAFHPPESVTLTNPMIRPRQPRRTPAKRGRSSAAPSIAGRPALLGSPPHARSGRHYRAIGRATPQPRLRCRSHDPLSFPLSLPSVSLSRFLRCPNCRRLLFAWWSGCGDKAQSYSAFHRECCAIRCHEQVYAGRQLSVAGFDFQPDEPRRIGARLLDPDGLSYSMRPAMPGRACRTFHDALHRVS